MKEAVKDKYNNIIGYTETLASEIAVYDKAGYKKGSISIHPYEHEAYVKGTRVGVWKKSDDTTYDGHYGRIGKGYLLVNLILQQ